MGLGVGSKVIAGSGVRVGTSVAIGGTDVSVGCEGVSANGTGVAVCGVRVSVGEAQPLVRAITASKAHAT